MNTQHEQRFSQLYSTTSRRLYAYLRRHTDPDQAESILSEVYLRAWRHLDRLDENPMGWLIVTARHALTDQRRADGRRCRLNDELFTAARSQCWTSPESEVVERQSLLTALGQLNPKDREALLLVGWDGLDHESAARVMGCTCTAFTKRLGRARQRLTELVDSPAPAPIMTLIPRKA